MNGRYRTGWYRHPDDDERHVVRISQIGQAWISTLWNRSGGRPCAAGTVLTKPEWRALAPADPIPGIDDAFSDAAE